MKLKSLVLTSSIILLAVSAPALADMSDGVEAYERGNYERAFEEWFPYAELGNINAIFNIGQLYRKGQGVDVDLDKAEEYYLKAAQQGHVPSARNLAVLYSMENFHNRNIHSALEWYERAALNGDAISQYRLGSIFYQGQVVKINKMKAYSLFFMARENGYAKAAQAEERVKSELSADEINEAEEYVYLLKQQKRERLRSVDPEDVVSSKSEEKIEKAPRVNVKKKTADKVKTKAGRVALGKVGYFAQLTSFRRAENTQKEWGNIKTLDADFFGRIDNFALVYQGVVKGRQYNRLQVGPFKTIEKGKNFCRKVKDYGNDCFLWKREY